MSWESTSHYYRLMNEAVRERVGGAHSADLLVRSVDFGPVAAMQHAGDWEAVTKVVVDAARALEAGGATTLMICTNSMHLVAPQVQAATSVPLLHIGDTTGRSVATAGITRVGLLGTAFTMEQPFLIEHLESNYGLDVVVPNADDRAMVHQAIYDELVLGIIDEATRMRLGALSYRMRDQLGIDGLILGCTELELLLGPDDLAVPWFPGTALHAAAGVEAMLSEDPAAP
jgi:aspartate racemase